jgi:hypothetical protein
MKIKLERDMQPQDAYYLKIIIGTNEYRIQESNGGFTINKIGDLDDTITITPMVSNNILIK